MKNTSLLSKIVNITTTIVMLILVVLTGLLVGVRLFGFVPYTINNNTMEPAYKKGSIVYVKDSSFEDIKVKDSITYLIDEDLTLDTHRVLEKDIETELFITKGDANNTENSIPVHYQNILGVVKYSVPLLGYLSVYSRRKWTVERAIKSQL